VGAKQPQSPSKSERAHTRPRREYGKTASDELQPNEKTKYPGQTKTFAKVVPVGLGTKEVKNESSEKVKEKKKKVLTFSGPGKGKGQIQNNGGVEKKLRWPAIPGPV